MVICGPNMMDGNITTYDIVTESVFESNTSQGRMRDLLEDVSQPITLANKVITCSATILTFLVVVISLRFLSKSPLLPANRYFLFSLVLSDLMQAGVVLPLSMTAAISENWDSLPPFVWLFQIAVSIHFWLTGIYSLAFVNVDHYIAVTESSHYLHQLGPRKAACWVIFIWILGISYCFPLFLIGPDWVVQCSSSLMFCIINYNKIAAYSITSIIILLPPPLIIFVATGYRGLFPLVDDTYKSSVERSIMFRANTAAGIVTVLLWFIGTVGTFAKTINPVIRLVTFWLGVSAPIWRAVCYWGVAAPILKHSYGYSELRKSGY